MLGNGEQSHVSIKTFLISPPKLFQVSGQLDYSQAEALCPEASQVSEVSESLYIQLKTVDVQTLSRLHVQYVFCWKSYVSTTRESHKKERLV